MPVCNLSDLPHLLSPGQCLLGLDPGQKTVGIAIADPGGHVASPLAGLARPKLAVFLENLARIVKERNVGGLIVGLPKALDGSEGPAAQSARTLASHIGRGPEPLSALPIVFWDERFSTAGAQRFMIEDDMSRARRKDVIDKAAAAYILQGALDALACQRSRTP